MSEGACDVRRLLSSKKGEDGEGGGVSFDLFYSDMCENKLTS